jgi:SsrA-binding protein
MGGSKKKSEGPGRMVRENRKAFHLYEILDRYEAGVCLVGTEVKSIRAGNFSIDQAYVKLRGGELYLVGMNVTPYDHASAFLNHEPTRPRKLLLHRSEIRRIASKINERGLTVVPLKLYFNDRGLLKVTVGLARGKVEYDKRREIRKRESDRQLRRFRKRL